MRLGSDGFQPTTMIEASTEGKEVFIAMLCNPCHRDYEADRYCPVCIETYHAPSTQSSPNASEVDGEPIEEVISTTTASKGTAERPQRAASKQTKEQVAKALADSEDEDEEDEEDGEDGEDHSTSTGSILPERGRPRRSRLPPQRYPAGGEVPIALQSDTSTSPATTRHKASNAGYCKRPPPIPPVTSPDNDESINSQQADKDMVCCDRCDRWVHVTCDPTMTPTAYARLANDTDTRYVCPLCARFTVAQLAARRPLQHGRAGQYPRYAQLLSNPVAMQKDAAPVPVRAILPDATGQRGLVAPALHATGHGWFGGDGRFRDQPGLC
ncbi:hypothetical protein BDF22DRAFT_330916 [Syncephalis plumigaleata]|nr:hypothetical protein BDF22DRAFT_330916 [Syncephalis plumigaleata]